MRLPFQAFAIVALLAAGFLGAGAFTHADLAPRAVEVSIVGDAAAYLALAPNGDSPHDCFVDVTNGKVSITFDGTTAACGADGGGTGLNAGDGSTGSRYSRYAFHDILNVTNKGTKPIRLWVNATTNSGGGSLIEVAKKATAGQMGDADYAASATSITVPVGSTIFVGVRVKAGSLDGGSVAGAIQVEARRS